MNSSRYRYLVGVCAVAVATTGCAARRPAPTAEPHPAPSQAAATQSDSLETFIGKVRTISSQPARSSALTLEAQDPVLAKALLLLEAAPSAARHRDVADAYLRLGVSDQAHEHLSAAVKLEPHDAASWDRMARIWRDWGFPHLGLSDAHRAVFYAPASPAAHNTLGTVLHALGRNDDARTQFERALQLDPTAAYALNNLCYTWTLDGQVGAAVTACQRALAIQPDLQLARNNLGLAYAVGGSLEDSERAFASGGEQARAHYNMGIVYLARRQHADALKAFEAAQRTRPEFAAAAAMARQAWQLANRSN
jgi:tetratricopeptide (TPR) repeat protein